jgi:drug/metabolite transporter (DMT)-like permease
VLGSLALVACAFCWSTAGLFIKLLDWNPLWIASLRSLIAGVFLVIVVRPWKIVWTPTLVLAAVANALCMVLFVLANKMTTSANAILIQYWAPVPTALLAVYLLKEKLHPEQIAALLATLAGLVLLFADKLGPGALWGNLAALASGLAFAFMLILNRRQKDGNPVHSMLLSQFMAGLGTLALAAFQPLPIFTPISIALILALGVVQMGLAALFFAWIRACQSPRSRRAIARVSSAMSGRIPDAEFLELVTRAENLAADDQGPAAQQLRWQTMRAREWNILNEARTKIRWAWHRFFEQHDFLIAPIMPTTAFPHNQSPFGERSIEIDGTKHPYFSQTFWAGLAGVAYLPGTVIPGGAGPDGLPIGVQIIGPAYGDLRTIQLAQRLEQHGFAFVPPPACA